MRIFIIALSLLASCGTYAQKAEAEIFAKVPESVGNISFTAQGNLTDRDDVAGRADGLADGGSG